MTADSEDSQTPQGAAAGGEEKPEPEERPAEEYPEKVKTQTEGVLSEEEDDWQAGPWGAERQWWCQCRIQNAVWGVRLLNSCVSGGRYSNL